ncbi:hypothetical protein DFP72DRAFT_1119637 [Ephemerocybe angulata]|uniref:Uncharacterized protein n=1 Tax=Ephemerocybe angulata TaxID=980116 RepID=A0A8H6HYT7_9AGAR|nr:hypothetical protein DFP72DRAFT_1119637 [Tulosesus angulatus]
MPSHRRISAGRRQRIRINALLQTAASDLSKSITPLAFKAPPPAWLLQSQAPPARPSLPQFQALPIRLHHPLSPLSIRSPLRRQPGPCTSPSTTQDLSRTALPRFYPFLPLRPSKWRPRHPQSEWIRRHLHSEWTLPGPSAWIRQHSPSGSIPPTPTPSIEMDRDDDDALSYASMDTNASMDTIVPARDATVLAYHTQVDIGAIRESVHHLREAVRVLSAMVEAAAATGSRPLV